MGDFPHSSELHKYSDPQQGTVSFWKEKATAAQQLLEVERVLHQRELAAMHCSGGKQAAKQQQEAAVGIL